MIGSESMTSMDWMFLALSSMGNSQKKVAESFVQRLLEKGDIHPAVAILIGLGETADAIEVYVSSRYYMEAVLLTCLIYPRDWQRISHLVRKWGETAVVEKQPDLAVRCFSCTSMEASEAYLSPRSQDPAYAQVMGALSPPLSPPGSSINQRLRPENAGLKLMTSFQGNKPSPQTAVGVTPIAESAMSPGGLKPRRFDPTSARTATPGGYARNRLPSQSGRDRSILANATPLATTARSALPLTAVQASRDQFGRPSSRASRAQSISSASSASSARSARSMRSAANRDEDVRPAIPLPTLSPMTYNPEVPKKAPLPSPAHGVFDELRSRERSRNGSRTRKPDNLYLDMQDDIVEAGPETGMTPNTGYETATTEATTASRLTAERLAAPSPPLTGVSHVSMASAKVRSIDKYINSLQEANYYHQEQRRADKDRASSREPRGGSRTRGRDRSETREPQVQPREPRGRAGVRYIKSSKRSPSSPVSMSPDDPALQVTRETFDDENFYRVTSPVEPILARGRSKERPRGNSKQRSSSKTSKRPESPGSVRTGRSFSKVKSLKPPSRHASPDRNLLSEGRGRSQLREGSFTRSPSSPLPMSAQAQFYRDDDDLDDKVHSAGSGDDRERDGERVGDRVRKRSSSRRAEGRSTSNRRDGGSPDRFRARERSRSRNPARDPLPDLQEDGLLDALALPKTSTRTASRSRMPRLQTNLTHDGVTGHDRALTRKEIAAKELEERRLSLARRTPGGVSHPDDIEKNRSPLLARSPLAMDVSRSQSHTPMSAVDNRRYDFPAPQANVTGTSTSSVPIGLPATPRAMRHPKYMTADPNDVEDLPAVPEVPSNFSQQHEESSKQPEDNTLLLPATTFGQKSPSRSASVPMERMVGQRRGSVDSNISAHARKNSTANPASQMIPSIDETISDDQVVIIEDPTSPQAEPPLLPELQHLAGPPPPPPPPSMHQRPKTAGGDRGVISIAIDGNAPLERHGTPGTASTTTGTVPTLSSSRTTTPAVDSIRQTPTPSQSPQAHRRGRGSVGGDLGSKFRNVRDRMRSTSRNRVKSPAHEPSFTPSPYESVPPPINYPTHLQRTNSPPGPQTQVFPYESMMPPPPPPVPALPGQEAEKHAAYDPQGYKNPKDVARANMQEGEQGRSNSNTPYQGYRNPKELRANMPPDYLQQGVYNPAENVL